MEGLLTVRRISKEIGLRLRQRTHANGVLENQTFLMLAVHQLFKNKLNANWEKWEIEKKKMSSKMYYFKVARFYICSLIFLMRLNFKVFHMFLNYSH